MKSIALAVTLMAGWLICGSALAGSLFFEAAPTGARTFCPAPCFHLHLFYEDPTRTLDIQAIQFEIDLQGDVALESLCLLCDPPNYGSGNATLEDPEGVFETVPWNLSTTIAPSPTAGFDVLIVAAADAPFDVETIQTLHERSVACSGPTSCALQREALAANRIYLGRFWLSWRSGPLGVRVGGITGNGPAIEEIGRLEGAMCSFETGGCHVPEPQATLLLGVTFAALSVAARRGRRSRASRTRSSLQPGNRSARRVCLPPICRRSAGSHGRER